jgi:transporter family-2 protein
MTTSSDPTPDAGVNRVVVPTAAASRLVIAGLLAFGAGLVMVIQSRINGQLGHLLNDGILAAVMTLGSGLLILLVITALRRSTRTRLTVVLPKEFRSGGLRWWQLIGGLGGATIVASQTLTVPILGVALFTVLLVAGTTSASLMVDRRGLGPGGARPVTFARVVAAVVTTLAVALAISGRVSAGSFAWGAALLVLIAGIAGAFQQAINGVVAQRTGDSLVAGVVNFVGGFVALLVALAFEHLVERRPWTMPPAPWNDPVLWLAGPLGVAFIVTAAFVVKPLGVLLFSLLSIAGQLSGSLASDLLLPTPGSSVERQLVLAIGLAGLAVAFAALAPLRSTRSPSRGASP